MKLQKVLPLATIFVGLATLPSLAGSSYVENSYRLHSVTNGSSTTNIHVNEVYEGTRSSESNASKTVNGHTTVTEHNDGRTFHETDNFDITTTSHSSEDGEFSNSTDVNVHETYHFTGFEKDHRVTSGYDF